ncbi:hypothetical protein [Methanolobus sp.]|jgi:uncharacterized protein YjbJ (UPF0337 family)|nr:hypothetical protein [Methanolobus sp.]
MKISTKNQAESKNQNAAAAIKGTVGESTNDTYVKAKGKAEKSKGKHKKR